MALGGGSNVIKNDVITTYKADVVHHKNQLHSLAASEKRFAEEAEASAKKRSEAWKQMGKDTAIAFAGVASAVAIAKAGIAAAREETRLSSGAAGVDLDRLGKAFDGLRTRTELMTIAQAGARGAWKLNTAQLEQVVGGMRALEKQGFDTVDITNKITDALKKGKTEGLDDFGISLKATGDTTKDLEAFLRAMNAEVNEVGGEFAMAGDEAARAGVIMENAFERVKVKIGEVALTVIGLTEDIARMAARAFGGERKTMEERAADVRDRNLDEARARQAGYAFGAGDFRASITGVSTGQGREEYELLQQLTRGDMRYMGHGELMRRRDQVGDSAMTAELQEAYRAAAEESFNFHMFQGPEALEKLKEIGLATYEKVNATLWDEYTNTPEYKAQVKAAADAAKKR
jgi:hypothetical protein